MSFETIKEFYDLQLWNKEQLKKLVDAECITPAQYKEITGDDYTITSTPIAQPVA